jgi:hypothetical protein
MAALTTRTPPLVGCGEAALSTSLKYTTIKCQGVCSFLPHVKVPSSLTKMEGEGCAPPSGEAPETRLVVQVVVN